MSDDNHDPAGDAELWIGPIGPIPVTADDDPRRKIGRAASRDAQAATTCAELVSLVEANPDPLVRMEAVPRLKARFPMSDAARTALVGALRDPDDGVRCEAISAVSDLAIPGAGDLLVAALNDAEPDVRFFAAIGLQQLDDPRAPVDAESFAYGVVTPGREPKNRSSGC